MLSGPQSRYGDELPGPRGQRSRGPAYFTPPPGKDPIYDREQAGDEISSTDL
jgi:hypothetical protein